MTGISPLSLRACLPLACPDHLGQHGRARWLPLLEALGVVALVAACGSTPEPQAPQIATSAGAEPRFGRSGMEVSGLFGTIPQSKILATLEPKLPSLQRCFERGAEQVALIAGRMELYFRVALDGQVEWVYPRASTVGHRPTEQCLLEVAQTARFPEPKGGGPAELAWSFEMDGLNKLPPPVEWEPARVEPIVREQRAALAACSASGLVVTAYVAPGGQVMAAGASAASHEAASQIDCVVAVVRAWTMPDPGSYAAKVTFPLP